VRSRNRRSTAANSAGVAGSGGKPSQSVSESVRNPGGSNPKYRRAISSPSSSYFAPPIPWMNRSPSKNRLNRVVVRARVRSRIEATADPMGCAVLRQAGVVDLLVARELGQQVGREPEETFGLADRAQRDLQVGNPPGLLELAPRQREAQARRIDLAPSTDHAR